MMDDKAMEGRAIMMCPHCKTNNELPSYLAPLIFCCYCGKKLSGLPKDKPPLLSEDIRNCLDCAREAIVDAICYEDGLDGGTGKTVIKWITDILGDYNEWIKTHSDD